MGTQVFDFRPAWLDPVVAERDIRNRRRQKFLSRHKSNWFWKCIAVLRGF